MQTTSEQLNISSFHIQVLKCPVQVIILNLKTLYIINYKNLLPFLPNSGPPKNFCILWAQSCNILEISFYYS